MSVQRTAVIFDNTLRPETTGFYCRRGLGDLADVEHFLPDELSQLPPSRFDLFLSIDDGLRYDVPRTLRPLAYWAIDTHLELARSLERARTADLVFAAQKEGVEALRREGLAAEWLPLACDPDIHRRHEVAKDYDWCFVGNLLPGERQRLVSLLQREFPGGFIGQRYFREMAGSIEMELIHIPVEARWEGEAPFCTGCVALRLRCLGSDCEDFTLEYGDCTCVGGGFGLHDCSCEPLVLVFEGGGGNPCCDQPATSHLRVTVTE